MNKNGPMERFGNDPAIEISNLTKEYGTFRALDRLTLQIDRGEIFGFLGSNGAGKTTTIRILMGMLVPTDGIAKMNGLDCQEDRVKVKKNVGYLPDNPTFHDYLTGEQILNFVGRMHGIEEKDLRSRSSALMDEFHLTNATGEYAVNYSSGMKKKLALACARIHEPDVYILDEPMRGLDPASARNIQNWIKEITSAEEKTVFLSTHILERAETLCTSVGIIHEGKLLEEGTTSAVRDKLRPDGSLEDVFLTLTQEVEESGAKGEEIEQGEESTDHPRSIVDTESGSTSEDRE